MPRLSEAEVLDRLRQVKFPGYSRDVVSFGLVRDVKVSGGDVLVRLGVATNNPAVPRQLQADAERVLRETSGVASVKVVIDISNPPETAGPAAGGTAIQGVKHVIAIASGKGGVGKSTVAANLAAALCRTGAKTGLCDCDIYGPSISLMFGATQEQPMATAQEVIIPLERYGVKLMSMGSLLQDDAPAILRGPMVTRATQQFLRQVDWSGLDYLILDLPPGTGDIQLTVVQTVALTGAIIVTTPQEVALIDARKASAMFAKVNVPILGLVENMSFFRVPGESQAHYIFGEGGGVREAKRLRVPLLGQIPLDIETREAGDRGMPVVFENAGNHVAQIYLRMAEQLRQMVEIAGAAP
ncbi:MAG TPA: Mrp/NBP35 family ATP-binding protein [Chthoniobacterales bacterium]